MSENKKNMLKSIRFNDAETDLFIFWSDNSDILVSEIKDFIRSKIQSKTEYQKVFDDKSLSVIDKLAILRNMRNKEYDKLNADTNSSNGIMVKTGNETISKISDLILKLNEMKKHGSS